MLYRKIEKAFVLSNARDVIRKGKIIYIPVYYIMFCNPAM